MQESVCWIDLLFRFKTVPCTCVPGLWAESCCVHLCEPLFFLPQGTGFTQNILKLLHQLLTVLTRSRPSSHSDPGTELCGPDRARWLTKPTLQMAVFWQEHVRKVP